MFFITLISPNLTPSNQHNLAILNHMYWCMHSVQYIILYSDISDIPVKSCTFMIYDLIWSFLYTCILQTLSGFSSITCWSNPIESHQVSMGHSMEDKYFMHLCLVMKLKHHVNRGIQTLSSILSLKQVSRILLIALTL